MRVSNEIRIFERNGETIEELNGVPAEAAELRVESHDHKKGLVVLKHDGIMIAVPARDLKLAVENATRTEG